MTLRTYDKLEQRTSEWYAQRCGLPTASVIGNLITTRKLGAIDYDCPNCGATKHDPCLSRRTGAAIKTLHPERAEYARSQSSATIIEPASNDNSRRYTRQIVAERLNGWANETRITDAMYRGIDDEPIARDKYSEHFAPATEIGFMVEDKWGFKIGYSPDGLVGSEGLIEIKSRAPSVQVETVLAGHPPLEVMPQLQTGLLVSGRKWIDYVSFAGGMHMWVRRIYPDMKWQNAIVEAVRRLEANAAEAIRQYREGVEGMPMTERTTYDLEIVA